MPGDSIFLRGSSHLVCEDYAMTLGGLAVVSDGCSSAPRSDVAARLVFLAARQAYGEARLDPEVNCGILRSLDQKALGSMARREELYATLLGARVFDSRVLITVVGDGHVILGRRDGTLEQLAFRYPLYNAPYYPVYALEEESELRWNQAYPGNNLVVESSIHPKVPFPDPLVPWFTFERSFADLDYVLLTSDGLGSFVDLHGESLGEAAVLTELCAFKSRKGEFLKRRVLRMMEDFRKRGIHHQDDFSAAILTFDEERTPWPSP